MINPLMTRKNVTVTRSTKGKAQSQSQTIAPAYITRTAQSSHLDTHSSHRGSVTDPCHQRLKAAVWILCAGQPKQQLIVRQVEECFEQDQVCSVEPGQFRIDKRLQDNIQFPFAAATLPADPSQAIHRSPRQSHKLPLDTL